MRRCARRRNANNARTRIACPHLARLPRTCLAGVSSAIPVLFPVVRAAPAYPYPLFPRETSNLSPRFISHRLVSPIRLLVLGRTNGTFLYYERSYVKNGCSYSGREPRPGCTCRPKTVRFSQRVFPARFSPFFFPRFFPAIFPRDFSSRFFPAIFPRDST